MRHDAHGFWVSDLPAPTARPALAGVERADVAIVGGGYTGMWTAWWLKQRAPDSRIVLVEADICGLGPSGRNGGFCNSLWFSLPALVARFGDGPALEVCRAAEASVSAVGEWCEQQGVDARFTNAGYLQVSTCEAQDETWEPVRAEMGRLGVEGRCIELTPEQVAERCASPTFRGGAFYPTAATVDPGRLAAGLRGRLIEAGVEVFERTPMRGLRNGGVDPVIVLENGELTAKHVVLAAGSKLLEVSGLRLALTATSSHMVVTEPVPDVLEEIGWTGGECITDSRSMIHYFRTTADDRIAFGWGGGKVVYGSHAGRRANVDPGMVRRVTGHLLNFFPQLEGRAVVHGWGGPIDVSPTHLPMIRSLGERVHAGFGYTGNGVGPSQMIGRALASLALEHRDEHTSLAFVDPPPARVPPEPFRYIGGNLIRSAILHKEQLEEQGRRPGPLTRAVCGIPERVGIHVGR